MNSVLRPQATRKRFCRDTKKTKNKIKKIKYKNITNKQINDKLIKATLNVRTLIEEERIYELENALETTKTDTCFGRGINEKN